jgi:hypothetical protein
MRIAIIDLKAIRATHHDRGTSRRAVHGGIIQELKPPAGRDSI